MNKFKDQPENVGKIAELIKLIVIELITAVNSQNYKTRLLAEEIFGDIA